MTGTKHLRYTDLVSVFNFQNRFQVISVKKYEKHQPMTQKTLTDLYQYFDDLFDQNASQDTLFASSYFRGFIAVEAVAFGDDSQLLSGKLYQQVLVKMRAAKTELSQQDRTIVENFYQKISCFFLSNQ